MQGSCRLCYRALRATSPQMWFNLDTGILLGSRNYIAINLDPVFVSQSIDIARVSKHAWAVVKMP